MATRSSSAAMAPQHGAIPQGLMLACFGLLVANVTFLTAAAFNHCCIYDDQGLGIPTDFVNVWAAGKLVLDGHPALAYDWDIQKKLEVAILGRDFGGHIAWHYPPPFLFIAGLLAHFPYAVAFIVWVAVSIVPYLLAMRAIVGRPFGWLLAVAFPVVLANAMVGQNGFLTAALIGGTLYLLPLRPVLAGICLGLLTYKPQYGLLFPLVLIAASYWTAFFSAAVTAVALALVSWLVFGTESWQAFVHWLPMVSQAFLTEGRVPFGKFQSIFALVRYAGGAEQLAWTLQWIMSGTVAVLLVLMWRNRQIDYSLKAAALATGTLLITPYLFMYDVMVLAIPIAFLIRIGLVSGFRRYELPALACALALFAIFVFREAPFGFFATLIVAALIVRRAVPWWRHGQRPSLATAGV